MRVEFHTDSAGQPFRRSITVVVHGMSLPQRAEPRMATEPGRGDGSDVSIDKRPRPPRESPTK